MVRIEVSNNMISLLQQGTFNHNEFFDFFLIRKGKIIQEIVK